DDSGKHDKPKGGVHTGGGALATVSNDDWEKDKGEEKDSGYSKSDEDKSWKHDKPQGGVHTGGGGLAVSGSAAAAGTVLLLGGLGAGAYMLRRRGSIGANAA
ncbi:hypothetical protein ABZY19_28100, partial [Streptomyces sp. NPDC006475]